MFRNFLNNWKKLASKEKPECKKSKILISYKILYAGGKTLMKYFEIYKRYWMKMQSRRPSIDVNPIQDETEVSSMDCYPYFWVAILTFSVVFAILAFSMVCDICDKK